MSTLQCPLRRVGGSVLGLFIAFGAAAPVSAQTYICPSGAGPGERQVGMTGGGPGLASLPVCVQVQQEAPRRRAPAPSPPDPMVEQARAMSAMARDLAGQIKAMENDPEFRKLRAGHWVHFKGEPVAGERTRCVALFKSLAGAVQIDSGTATANGSPLLSFWGTDIPRPAAAERVRVVLDQGPDQVREVGAINHTVIGGQMGAISFGLPNIEAGLDGMKDNQSFKVSIQGKPVVDLSYHGGLAARDEMRKCLKGT